MRYIEKYNRYIDDDLVIYRQNSNDKLIQVTPSITDEGYAYICYDSKHIVYVHRLVYETFIGTIPDGYEVDHIDRNRLNNKISNLRIVTHIDNMKNIKCKMRSEFGIKFKEHYGINKKDNIKLYDKERYWYKRHNKTCRWEVE